MTRSALCTLFLGLLAVHAVSAAYCHGKPDPNAKPNNNAINKAAPKLLRTSKNGKLYQAGTEGNEFYVIHVYGTAYERGFAHGTLLQDEVRDMMNRTWLYMESQVTDALNGLPNWLKDDIANFGLDVALDYTAQLTAPFTGQYFFDEIRGLADASGTDYQTILRIHLIGELTKGDCSMFGAWGPATASTGKTLQLRSLDWDVDGPFKDFPAVLVEHPTDGGHPFASLGFVGWLGSLSGQSSQQMAISEIGVSFPDATFGAESRRGTPFTFLLRDVLQFDKTLDDTINRMETANRTCDLILGAGDGKSPTKTFRAFQYSYSVANVISDTHFLPVNSTWHAPIPNVVYFGMDWLCPAYNKVLHDQLQLYYGNITAENTIHGILPVLQSGNVHAAVYDLTDSIMFVSMARRSTVTTGPAYAFDREFTALNLNALWAEAPPSKDDTMSPMLTSTA